MRLVRRAVLRRRGRHRLREAVDRGRRLTGTAVVVVNWNRADLTIRAARAVLDDPTSDAAVIVVDNGSTDGSEAALRTALPDATVLRREDNGGFAVGVNAGIRATDAGTLVLLNNDAVPAPGFVAALRTHLDRAAPEVAAVTARILLAGRWTRCSAAGSGAPADGRTLHDHAGTAWVPAAVSDAPAPGAPAAPGVAAGDERLNSTGVRIDRDGNGSDRDWLAPADTTAPVRVFGFSGGAAALRRSALDDVGLFDESLFMYYEDAELSWRFARRGWRVEYAADAVVTHDHSSSSGVRSDLFLFRNARNRLVVALWHAPAGTVLRAAVRTAGRGVRGVLRPGSGVRSGTGREARLVLAALADVLGHLPRHLARRSRETARASVPRRAIDTAG